MWEGGRWEGVRGDGRAAGTFALTGDLSHVPVSTGGAPCSSRVTSPGAQPILS